MRFNIKEKRESINMTQEKLAEAAGISRGTLSRLESNEETIANTKTLGKIAEALGCPVGDLFVQK